MKHFVYLIIGIVITIVFFALSCSDDFPIYEKMMSLNQGYFDQMYNNQAYRWIALITIVIAWGAAALYYFVIDSVKFDRWYHWLSVLGIVAVITPVVCYFINDSILELEGEYVSEAISFEFQTVLFSALLFIVASYSMRWWSRNCRHTPFPQ